MKLVYGFLIGFYGKPYINWGLLPFFLNFPLCVICLVLMILMWRKWHWKGIIPLGLLIIFFLGFIFSRDLGRLVTTQPQNPQNFFTEKTKNELTLAAEKLLESKYQYVIRTFPKEPYEIQDMEGKKISDVPNNMVLILKKYSIHRVEVNPDIEMVKFGFYYIRDWHEYIYYKDIKKIPPSFDKKLADHWYYYSW